MAGRPSPIDVQIATDERGAPITVADVIVSALRAGSYFEQAAATAGVAKETAYAWLRTAGRVRLRARGAPITTLRPRPTAHELRCVAFSDSVATAESTWETGALATLERLARGGIPIGKRVVKRGPSTIDPETDEEIPGPILEVTEYIEFSLPSAQVLEWRLERRFPNRYGRRVEISGAEGGPIALTIEERAAALAETLKLHLRSVEDAKPKRGRHRKAANGDGAHLAGPT